MGIWWRALLPLLIVLAGCVDLKRPDLVTLTDAAGPRPDAPWRIGWTHRSRRTGPRFRGRASRIPGDGPPGSEDGQDPPDTQEPDKGPDPLPAGAPCDGAGQCASGYCSQGTCCDKACGGACVACNLAGSEGTCKAVAAGEDPGESCAQEPLTTCGPDGTCDGAGACRRYPA